MRWTEARAGGLALLLLVVVLFPPVFSAVDKRLTLYTAQTTESFALTERDGALYVNLPEVMQAISASSISFEKNSARLRVHEKEGLFEDGKRRVRIGRANLEMPAASVVQEGRLLVPMRSLPTLLTQYLGKQIEFHEQARRLFLDQPGLRFTTELKTEPASITFTFSSAVNPNVSSEGNKVRLHFSKEPVVTGASAASFPNEKLISGWVFHEENGAAELVVQGTGPLLATFSDGGRKVIFAAAPGAPQAAQQPGGQPAPATLPGETAPATTPATQPAASSEGTSVVGRYFVLIDASHGGNQPGAQLSESLYEKEITQSLARRLRNELQSRGILAVILRDDDTAVGATDRAVAANSQRANIYVALHASASGKGLRVVSALVPSQLEKKGMFLPWDAANLPFAQSSNSLAQAVTSEAAKKKISARMMSAPVAPLSSIAAPAIALEISPPRFGDPAETLKNAAYQQSVAASTAIALAQSRGRMVKP